MSYKTKDKLVVKSLERKVVGQVEQSRKVFIQSHNLYPYYKLAKGFNDGEKRLAVVHAVGTGKSFLAIQWLSDELTGGVVPSNKNGEPPVVVEPKQDVHVLYLSPKRAAYGQIVRHAQNLEETELLQHVERETYSGLLKKFKDSYGAFELEDINEEDEIVLEDSAFVKYINQFTHIVLDEFHHADENKWGYAVKCMLSCNPNAKVLGLTATPTRSSGTNTADSLFDGKVVSTISLADAIVNEILPFPQYTTSVYSYDKLIKKYEERVSRIADKTKKKEATQEVEDIKRMITKAKGAKELIVSAFRTNPNGKFIIFCNDIKTSHKYVEDVVTYANEAGLTNPIVFNVNSDNPDSEAEIAEFDKLAGKGLKLLFAVDMLNESVHVPDIDGVIMMRDTNSYIVFHQQLGRALSVGNGKRPLVLDLVDNINSAFEYREVRIGAVDLFREIARKSKNAEIKDLSLQTINENEVMKKLYSLDEKIGVERMLMNEKLEIITQAISAVKAGQKIDGIVKKENGYKIYNSCIYNGYRIGNWVDYAKRRKVRGVDEHELVVGLEQLGIDLSVTHGKKFVVLPTAKKLQIITEAIQEYNEKGEVKGITFNNGKYWFSIDCVYNGYKVGGWISSCRHRTAGGEVFRNELEKLNIDISVQDTGSVPLERKLQIIAEAIANFNNNPNTEGITLNNGKYKFAYAYTYNDYKVGQWISRRDTLGDSSAYFTKQLANMGVDVTASARAISTGQKLEIIQKAIEVWQNGEQIAGISNKNGKIYIINTCTYQGYNIGHWVHNIKNKVATNELLIDGLNKLNVDIELSKKSERFMENLEVIKRAIKNKAEGIQFLDNGLIKIAYNCRYEDVWIGLMVANAKSGDISYKPFVEGLKAMNIDFSVSGRAVDYKKKVEIIARAIADFDAGKEVTGIRKENGKYRFASSCVYQGHKLGNWVQNIRLGFTNNKVFIKMLEEINVYLEPPVKRTDSVGI